MVAMVTKCLRKMEVELGFVQIPAKYRAELICDNPVPFHTNVNGAPAKVDKYGRIWSEYLRNRYPADTEVTISKNDVGFQVTVNRHKEDGVTSETTQPQVSTERTTESRLKELVLLELDKIYFR